MNTNININNNVGAGGGVTQGARKVATFRRTFSSNKRARITTNAYTKNYYTFLILGILIFIVSLLELVFGGMIHFLIAADGIGAWWAALTPIACAIFALKVTSSKRLAGMLLNAILGIITTIIGCIIEFNDSKRLSSIDGCYDSVNNEFSFFYPSNDDYISLETNLNKTCTGAFSYVTSSPIYDCWCIGDAKYKCITFDIGKKSKSCHEMFKPIPPDSKIITYSLVSASLCIVLLILCFVISILGCTKAMKEEVNQSDPLKLVNMARQDARSPLDPAFSDVISVQVNDKGPK